MKSLKLYFYAAFKELLKTLTLLSLHFYRIVLGPQLGGLCRFEPSCSQYAVEAVEMYGPIKGIHLTLLRLKKCHPRGSFGHDPVPKKQLDS